MVSAAVFGGLAQGIPQGLQDAQQLEKLYEGGLDRAGQVAFGNWLTQMQGPKSPMGGGMPPPPMGGMPGQPPPQQMAGPPPIPQGSPPMAPPQGGAQVGAPTPQPMARGPIGQPGQGQQFQQDFNQTGGMGGPQGGFDVRQIVMSIAQANPGIRPEVLARATQQAIGTVLPPQIREQALQQAMQLGLLRVGAQNYRTDVASDTAQRGQDIRAETAAGAQATAQRGQDIRAQTQEKAESGRQTRFDEREGRIKAQAAIKNDQQWQQLGLRRQALENQIHQGNARQYLAQWRAILDAQHKRTTEIIQAYAVNNNVPPAQRDQMLKESDEAYQRAITDMSKSDKGPTGGGQQPSP